MGFWNEKPQPWPRSGLVHLPAGAGARAVFRLRSEPDVPPFEGVGKRRIALAKLFEVSVSVYRIGERGNHVGDDKPPFVVVDGAADLLPLEQCDAPFGILFCVAHG